MITSDPLSISVSSFSLIALAEFGDKSQLVCMTLAAQHRHWPVMLGSIAAFSILNTLAVLFGTGVAHWLPEQVTAGLVAILFAVFGIFSLYRKVEDDPSEFLQNSGNSIFLTTFLLILVAEFGDKTQIAVAGLASNMSPLPVWIGATTALIVTSGLGVWAGRTLLQRFPVAWLHRFSGGLFLVFAMLAAWKAFFLI